MNVSSCRVEEHQGLYVERGDEKGGEGSGGDEKGIDKSRGGGSKRRGGMYSEAGLHGNLGLVKVGAQVE
jgi:hypothetical protein